MVREKYLKFVLKLQICEGDKKNIIGTAFLINSSYAITAEHVIERCNGQAFELVTNDGEFKITNCIVEYRMKIKERNIDIALIRFNSVGSYFNQCINLSGESPKLKDSYETYGYPQLNKFDAQYISGEIISPEGRMSIYNSTGEHAGISLYQGVSGAPLIIDGLIYGIISDEGITTRASKPELFSSNFADIIKYFDEEISLDKEQKALYKILKDNSKKNIVIPNNIDPDYDMYDNEYATLKDKRNLSEKVLTVCPQFNEKILDIWKRNSVSSRNELESGRISSDQKKAIIMAVFMPCIEYINEELINNTFSDENVLRDCIAKLKIKVLNHVVERKKDYNYGIENNKVFENTIFNLIDLCFLSFDDYVKEGGDVL